MHNAYSFIMELLEFSTKKVTKDGYVTVHRKGNGYLFQQLRDIGFFDFHPSNRGYIIGVHQVVAFLDHGYKALENGFVCLKGQMEIHHLNGVRDDNRPENLVYVSPEVNQVMDLGMEKREYQPILWNKRGRPISNQWHYILNILTQSVLEHKKVRNNGVIRRYTRQVAMRIRECHESMSRSLKGFVEKHLLDIISRKYNPSYFFGR